MGGVVEVEEAWEPEGRGQQGGGLGTGGVEGTSCMAGRSMGIGGEGGRA
jgi:hypothetical protein